MSRKENDSINVRIPRVLFEEIERVTNQVPITEADGTTRRVNEPFGLTNSNTALVNTTLLALLSTILPSSRVTLLTQMTPSVNMTYVNEAKKRLAPDRSINVPVAEIVDIVGKQQEGFDRISGALEKMYTMQQLSDNKVIMDQGILLQMMAYWIGVNSQSNVSDPNTYNDASAIAVKKATVDYGDQHLTDFRLSSSSVEKDSESE